MTKQLFFYILGLLSVIITSCDISDNRAENDIVPTTYFGVNISYIADTSLSYWATFNGDSFNIVNNTSTESASGGISIPRSALTGTFKLYYSGETTPIITIDTTLTLNNVIRLIQLPGQAIQLVSSVPVEADPDTRNCVKVRFYYTDTTMATSDSMRMIIQARVNIATSTTYKSVDTLFVVRGKLSKYVNLDLAKYWTSNTAGTAYTYNLYDLTNPKSPTLLIRRLDLISSTTTYTNENGPIIDDKFMTYKLSKVYSNYTIKTIDGLCTDW